MGKKRTVIPKQKRSIETRQKIKDTAYQLYSAKGYHGTSSNEIASVSGVNIGTFYNYFEDKKVLLLELIEDFQQRFFDITFALEPQDIEELDFKETIALYLRQSFNAYRKDRAFFKSVYPLQYIDKDVEKIFRKYERLEARQVTMMYQQKTGPMAQAEVEKQILVVSVISAAVINRFFTLGMPIGKKELIRVMTPMLVSTFESLVDS